VAGPDLALQDVPSLPASSSLLRSASEALTSAAADGLASELVALRFEEPEDGEAFNF